ncbi:hypothetical protein KUF71_024133 [Frankliniella fusca]|uniref:RNA-directed DNA polymerase n=1 Tax=Frankliniella fusca TaxID=407009 RepID=A0AAE1I0S4_9NEOP|nr:hypothetical protein KUF71_024133 [Frankliniella fusca]
MAGVSVKPLVPGDDMEKQWKMFQWQFDGYIMFDETRAAWNKEKQANVLMHLIGLDCSYLYEESVLCYLKAELYCENELLYFQIRLVIPNTLRPQLLQQLHSGHQGMVKCKSLASQSIFWPGINKDIESPSVIPNVVDKLTKKSLKAKAYYDSSANAKEIQYSPSDYVFIKNPLTGKWEPGMVINVCAEPRSYLVKTNSSNNVLRRNCTFLKPRSVSAPFRTPVYLLPSRTNVEIPNNHDVQNNNNNQIVIPLQEVNENLNRWREQLRERFAQGARQERPPVQTRSGRVVNKPDRLNL